MSEDKSIVWILGAGASRSLGGHLLQDLLSEGSELEVGTTCTLADIHRSVYHLYRSGLRNSNKESARLWDHAEDFLAYLDHATSSPIERAVIEKLIAKHWPLQLQSGIHGVAGPPKPPTIRGLRDAAKGLVALECAFTEFANLEDEKWQPYLRWADLLKPQDRVITFNYDLVLEKLKRDSTTLLAHYPIDSKLMGVEQVYKLHGSIDWILEGNPPVITKAKDHVGLMRSLECPVIIAIPGRSKRETTSGHLKDVWAKAIDALKEADAVVFVGYKFPPSDAESRTRILGALGQVGPKYRGERRIRRFIHTVLGPNVNNDDTIRLKGLLEDSMFSMDWVTETPGQEYKHFKVVTHPLFAEDYFTVFTRDRILSGK